MRPPKGVRWRFAHGAYQPESPRCGSLLYDDNEKGLPLHHMSLDLVMEYYSIIYDIARHMLTAYGMYEE